MKKVLTMAVATLFLLTLFVGTVSAKTDTVQKIDIPKEWQGKDHVIVDHGNLIQVVWIKRVDDDKNPARPAGGPGKTPRDTGYKLASYRWDLSDGPVQYILNPKDSGLGDAVTDQVALSFQAWNGAALTKTDTHVPIQVFANGPETVSNDISIDTSKADSNHVIMWADLSDSNIIAMATMWYYRSTKELVDADMVFNTDFKWGIDSNGESAGGSLDANTYDVRNICTHESGHWASLNDMYDSQYGSLTMYGYGSPQETQKISLATADIAGVQAAY